MRARRDQPRLGQTKIYRPRFTIKNIFHIFVGVLFGWPIFYGHEVLGLSSSKDLLLIVFAPFAIIVSLWSFIVWATIRYRLDDFGIRVDALLPFGFRIGRAEGRVFSKNFAWAWEKIFKTSFREKTYNPIYRGDGSLLIDTKEGLYALPYGDAIDHRGFVKEAFRYLGSVKMP